MKSSPALIFRTTPHAAPDDTTPRVVAYGEADDHLRMTVLLASTASTALSRVEAGAPGVAETCCEPASSWRERHEALRQLLLYPSTPPYVIGDPEALLPAVPEQTPRWDDKAFHQERKELFDLLLDVAARRGDWHFVSTTFHPLLGAAFDKRGLAIEPSPTSITDLPATSPQLGCMAQALLNAGVISARRLTAFGEAATETEQDLDDVILSMAWDTLSLSDRQHALQLATVRPPMPINGAVGPFAWRQGPHDPDGLPRDSVERLLGAGFLLAATTTTRSMPRLVRSFLLERAALLDPEALAEWHLALARRDLEHTVEDRIERRVHAIHGGDLGLALELGEFYVNDLRELATSLSRDGHHDQAVDIYRHIVERDGQDAYAWEYLAFNLERSSQVRASEEVLTAYARASRLDPNNPLFLGRLLGFRASQGEDVKAEFGQRLVFFSRNFKQTDAVSYFVEAVVGGLERSGHNTLRDELVRTWERVDGR